MSSEVSSMSSEECICVKFLVFWCYHLSAVLAFGQMLVSDELSQFSKFPCQYFSVSCYRTSIIKLVLQVDFIASSVSVVIDYQCCAGIEKICNIAYQKIWWSFYLSVPLIGPTDQIGWFLQLFAETLMLVLQFRRCMTSQIIFNVPCSRVRKPMACCCRCGLAEETFSTCMQVFRRAVVDAEQLKRRSRHVCRYSVGCSGRGTVLLWRGACEGFEL